MSTVGGDDFPALRFLDLSFETPAENLAFDEAMLDHVEEGLAPHTLRLWESPVRFVVLGSAQVLHREVDADVCAAEGVPVMRRCTAGGCVLQGPGSLNYSLALGYNTFAAARDLHGSYCHILGRLARALAARGMGPTHEGICDLAVNGMKVSGNAQRRKRNAFLHHGTLLYRADHEGMEKFLREPGNRPEYRGERKHRDFVGALPATPGAIRSAVCEAFQAVLPTAVPLPSELGAMRRLVAEKYLDHTWIGRK